MDNLMDLINSVISLSHAKEIMNEVKTMLANNLAAKIEGGDCSMEDHEKLTMVIFELLASE
jgi:hypothetical protein